MPREEEEEEEEAERLTLGSNAIIQLPTTLRRRRKRIAKDPHGLLKRRRVRSKASREETQSGEGANIPDEDDAAVAALSDLSDTHIAIQTLRSQWPGEASIQLSRTPPIILRSQIQALVADGNIIDRELATLVATGVVRAINVPSARTVAQREAYVMMQDMRAAPPHDGSIFYKFFNDVLPHCTHPLIDQQLLADVYGEENEDAINNLVSAGYLTFVDEQTYALAVPGMGLFVKNRAAGQDQIIRLLRAAEYRELPLSKLEIRTLKKTVFTAQWHVRDVIGSGIANAVSTSVGTLVRLPHSTQ